MAEEPARPAHQKCSSALRVLAWLLAIPGTVALVIGLFIDHWATELIVYPARDLNEINEIDFEIPSEGSEHRQLLGLWRQCFVSLPSLVSCGQSMVKSDTTIEPRIEVLEAVTLLLCKLAALTAGIALISTLSKCHQIRNCLGFSWIASALLAATSIALYFCYVSYVRPSISQEKFFGYDAEKPQRQLWFGTTFYAVAAASALLVTGGVLLTFTRPPIGFQPVATS